MNELKRVFTVIVFYYVILTCGNKQKNNKKPCSHVSARFLTAPYTYPQQYSGWRVWYPSKYMFDTISQKQYCLPLRCTLIIQTASAYCTHCFDNLLWFNFSMAELCWLLQHLHTSSGQLIIYVMATYMYIYFIGYALRFAEDHIIDCLLQLFFYRYYYLQSSCEQAFKSYPKIEIHYEKCESKKLSLKGI